MKTMMIAKASWRSVMSPSFMRLKTAALTVSTRSGCLTGSNSNFNTLVLLRNDAVPAITSMAPTRLSVPRHYYSTTPFVSVSLGRRRRRLNSVNGYHADLEVNPFSAPLKTDVTEIPELLLHPKVFEIHVTELFDKIHQAMIPLVPINDVMILTRGDSFIEMRADEMIREDELREKIKREREEMKRKDPTYDPINTSSYAHSKRKLLEQDEIPKQIPIPAEHQREFDGPFLKIELAPIHGQYTFIADMEYNHVIFQSPTSGQFIYDYDTDDTNKWIHMYDKHSLIGLFVRDILRQIHGVPKL